MNKDLQRQVSQARTISRDDLSPRVGQWYWVKDVEGGTDTTLMCAMLVGSNFVKLQCPLNSTLRVHADSFTDRCELELDPKTYLDRKVQAYRERANTLLEKIKVVTAQLGIAPREQLGQGRQTPQSHALVTATEVRDPIEYKKALIKAKEQTLPALFKEMKKEHEMMARWMKGELLPLEVQSGELHKSIEGIGDHIFAVELYAGLVETVDKIQDGVPAPLETPVVLHQRLCYMDEECLANYEAGGMEFKTIKAFYEWLLKPENLNRILPHERCIVAFRVRRNTKERSPKINAFVRIALEDADRKTFLYIRNGEQVFWLQTKIDFGEHLFPDEEFSRVLDGSEPLYGEGYNEPHKIITKSEHDAVISKHNKEVAKWEEETAVRKAEGKDPWWKPSLHYQFHPFTPESVYYDDMRELLSKQVKAHNRVVVIIQGLLDRSEALHPHPPWQLWTPEGFRAGIRLLYDATRALPATIEPPDFREYQARLNSSLKKDSITVGQQWAYSEQKAERARMAERQTYFYDPGPGRVARVVQHSKKHQTCGYRWMRESERLYWKPDPDQPRWQIKAYKQVGVRATIPISCLLNVDAYTPGDYHIFFDDPRTRANYLKWAPLLLLAEDYHAGKLKLRED